MNRNNLNSSELLPLESWLVENLRLTSFPIGTPDEGVGTNWWISLFNQRPDTTRMLRNIRGQQEEGYFGNGKLVLTVQPARIDWLYTISIDQGADTRGIVTLGSFLDVLGEFADQIEKWLSLETCPDARRLAFGALLLHPVESLQNGYRILDPYLPNVKIDCNKGISDFLYQINRPVDFSSVIPDLRVNRLTKWSVAGLVWMQSNIHSIPALMSDIQTQEFFACRLELDVNTTAEFKGKIEREKLPDVLNELVRLGKEIVEVGDVE